MTADNTIRNVAEQLVDQFVDYTLYSCRNNCVAAVLAALKPVRALLIAAEKAGSTCMAIRYAFGDDRPVLTGLCLDAERLVLAALSDMQTFGKAEGKPPILDPEASRTACFKGGNIMQVNHSATLAEWLMWWFIALVVAALFFALCWVK